jgi:hypothetical protein
LLDSCKQRSEQQTITWRLQFNTNAKSVFATASMRRQFVVVIECCCIYVVMLCVCNFYCVCFKLLLLSNISPAAIWCNMMPPIRLATGCSYSFVLSSESGAAVAYRDMGNVFYLPTAAFQNLLDELSSLSGTFVAFFLHSRSLFLSGQHSRLCAVPEGWLPCVTTTCSCLPRHTKRCISLVETKSVFLFTL